MTLEIGTLLNNRYRINAVIAQGGMGAIYRAFDDSLGVEVAVKENLFSSEEASRQFHREATLLAALRHPNLPRVTDHFILSDQGQYLVMDFIEGEDIRQRLAKQNISEGEAVAIGAAVCDALAYLHNHTPPIIHRDIKPGNIKITPSGQVFLVDFGLAKVAQVGHATTTGAQALTPGYAPPEQYGQGTSPASDIYALGATLYAAMTGKVPEDGLARAMGSAQLTPLRAHNPDISEGMAQVIEHSMAVRQNERYTSANAFRAALLSISTATRLVSDQAQNENATRILAGASADATVRGSLQYPLPGSTSTSSRPGQSSQVISVPGRKKKFPLVGILIGVILLAAGAVVAVILTNQAPTTPAATLTSVLPTTTPTTAVPPTLTQPPPTATPLADTPTSPPPTATLPVVMVPTFTSTPRATPLGGGLGQIAFVSLRTNNLPQIWIMNSDGSQQKQVTQLPDGACQPDWSPDGKRLVFVTPCRSRMNEYRGSTLYLINADGSGLTTLPSLPGGDYDPAWSPDGEKIAFSSLREGIQHIFTISLADNRVTRISAQSSFDGKPAWSPDGKYIAFESTRLGSLQVWVMDSNGQNARMASIHTSAIAFSPQWSKDGVNLIYNHDPSMPVLYIKQFKDLAPEFKVSEEVKPVSNASFSADGFWLVFDSWKNNNTNIYSMASNGSMLTRLTDDAAVDYAPVWRP